ncbi:MAG: hypothetical protein LBE11_04150 [Prevotellaceae bacterium]|jgi:hypothetical protein|nr:hypothetical protein [Prevotellaceae bacterium]
MNEIIPKIKPSAPLLLKQNIINKIKMERKEMKKITLKKLLSIAAIVAILMMLPFLFTANNEAKAAMNLLGESIDKSDDLKTMVVKFLMLTTPDENFDAIRKDGTMVEHTFTILFGSQNKWRLEKSGRTSLFDGLNSYSWLKSFEMYMMTEGIAGFFGNWEEFLDPQNILRYEQQSAQNDGSEITMTETDKQIILTVQSKAKGDFINDYMKNSSIETSDNRRIYTFDKETKLIQAVQIQIFYNNKYHTVLESTSIEYNVSININKFLERPTNAEWTNLSIPIQNQALTGITSKEAANLIFTALANKNIEHVKEAFISWDKKWLKQFYGLKLIKLGDPFKSGLYVGEFVPYKIKFANGETAEGNIALRNDNQNKIWTVDGGL